MFLKSMQQRQRTSQTIDTFGGYCHKEVIDNAQWYDMKNMSADKFPAITTRSKRITVDSVSGEQVVNPVAITDKDGLVWIDSAGTLHAGGHSLPNFVSDMSEELQLINMGAYLIVWPSKVWANVEVLKSGNAMTIGADYGSMSSLCFQPDSSNDGDVRSEHKAIISYCDENGDKFQYAPKQTEDGKLKFIFANTLEEAIEKYGDYVNKYIVITTEKYPYTVYSTVTDSGDSGETSSYQMTVYFGFLTGENLKYDDTVEIGLGSFKVSDGAIWFDKSSKGHKLKIMKNKEWENLQYMVRVDFEDDVFRSQNSSASIEAEMNFPERVFMTDDLGDIIFETYKLEVEKGAIKKIGKNYFAFDGDFSVISVQKDIVNEDIKKYYAIVDSYHYQLVKSAYITYKMPPSIDQLWLQTNDMLKTIIDQNNASAITPGTDYFEYTATSKTASPITVSVEIPEMQFVTECGNRLWGCFYGKNSDGLILNEIYGSKLGDFSLWNDFSGLSTASYAASRGSDGEWTGVISYNNYPLFFKRNSMDKLYISSSGAHQIVTTQMQGIQPGSWKSAKIIDGILYYMSDDGIMSYDGSLPNLISDCLGGERYTDAVAGTYDYKYCISMKNIASGMWEFFVFDTKNGVSVKHDNTKLISAVESGTSLYMLCEENETNVLKCVNADASVIGEEEEDFTWHLESSAIGIVDAEHKYARRFTIRMKLPPGSAVEVLLKYDNSNDWIRQIKYFGSGLRSFSIPVRPRRCDHFYMKIVGIGDATIYAINREIDGGSVE